MASNSCLYTPAVSLLRVEIISKIRDLCIMRLPNALRKYSFASESASSDFIKFQRAGVIIAFICLRALIAELLSSANSMLADMPGTYLLNSATLLNRSFIALMIVDYLICYLYLFLPDGLVFHDRSQICNLFCKGQGN